MAYEVSLAIIGVGVLWFFGMMSMSTNDEHPMLKLIYVLLGLSTLVGLVGLGFSIASANSAPESVINMLSRMLWISSTVSILVGAYYMYYIILWVYAKILGMMGNKKSKKWGDKFRT